MVQIFVGFQLTIASREGDRVVWKSISFSIKKFGLWIINNNIINALMCQVTSRNKSKAKLPNVYAFESSFWNQLNSGRGVKILENYSVCRFFYFANCNEELTLWFSWKLEPFENHLIENFYLQTIWNRKEPIYLDWQAFFANMLLWGQQSWNNEKL